MKLVDSLGLTIHVKKSIVNPSQEKAFLVFILNSVTMTVRLTDEKSNNLKDCCIELLRKQRVRLRDYALVIVNIIVSEPDVLHAPQCYKTLAVEKNKLLKTCKGRYDSIVSYSSECEERIHWWIDNVTTYSKICFTW